MTTGPDRTEQLQSNMMLLQASFAGVTETLRSYQRSGVISNLPHHADILDSLIETQVAVIEIITDLVEAVGVLAIRVKELQGGAE